MRILVLHQHYWPEVAATAQLLTDLAEDLAARGHSVRVVCGQPSYRRLPGTRATLPSAEVHEGVSIERLLTYRPIERSRARRIAHYTSYFATSLARALRRPADVVLVLSPPPLLLGISGAVFEVLRGVPFVFVVEDLYPELALELGALSPGSVADALQRMADVVYGRAAHVVAISEEMGARLRARGVEETRLSVIHNWADTERVVPVPRDNAFARALGLADRFVVLYAGNVSSSLGLAMLPRAAEACRALPVELVVCGDGDARAPLEREVRSRGLTNVRFLPPQPRERLGELLGSSDVGLVTTRAGEQGLRFPSKLFGVMAAARPILAAADAGSELAGVIRAADCGQVVDAEDPDALADGLRALFALPDEDRRAMGRRGRAACERSYSRAVATPRYRELLERVAARS